MAFGAISVGGRHAHKTPAKEKNTRFWRVFSECVGFTLATMSVETTSAVNEPDGGVHSVIDTAEGHRLVRQGRTPSKPAFRTRRELVGRRDHLRLGGLSFVRLLGPPGSVEMNLATSQSTLGEEM